MRCASSSHRAPKSQSRVRVVASIDHCDKEVSDLGARFDPITLGHSSALLMLFTMTAPVSPEQRNARTGSLSMRSDFRGEDQAGTDDVLAGLGVAM
jgi:hypothetical protein